MPLEWGGGGVRGFVSRGWQGKHYCPMAAERLLESEEASWERRALLGSERQSF